MNEYKVGIYLRLSKDDSNTKESESIISQRSYIMNYLNENNYILCKEYVDDGISGTTFDRPGLEELLLDIKNKKINLVVTKDLSRLGRNNGKMSILLDEYFVKYNVRFIAINDNYDNFNNETTELVWLKNGINEMYALDISKKVKSSLKTRKKQGLYTGWKAPYGYKRSNKDYHKLIPDKNASLIVRKIFDLALKNNYSQIARILNNENIETPSSYANISYMHPEWSPTTIKEILTNQTYLGHTVQGKRKKISYKLKKEIKVKEEDWIIVKNTHEAIIDTNLFNQVQDSIAKRKNKNKTKTTYLLSDLLYCKECQHSINVLKSKDKKRLYCSCSYYRRNPKDCSPHSMNYQKLESQIKNEIKTIIEPVINSLEKETGQTEKINKISLSLQKSHINYLNKKITKEKYHKIEEELKKELSVIKNKTKYNITEILNDKSFLELIIEKIYITKDKNIELYLNFNNLS